ncbi:hypothetical protein [Actinomadura sp. 21ATH]|uniref:hypothetical protein n=1 Tax=Actinomadura sp. 21ATH TaxID=1735444 RepID=UPI0035C15FB9
MDDTFHSHPKVLAAEPAALGLWVVAGTWSSANLTDGFVPHYVLPRLLPDSDKLAEALVTCGLWRRAKGGYRFHDWSDYNPRSVDVKRERDAARERMRNLRAKRKAPGQPQKRSGEQQANVRDVFVTPSRPDPTRSSSNEELPRDAPPASPGPPARRADRGTRLPDDFPVTPAMRKWAGEKAPLCGMEDHEAFCDYWRSVPGAKGRKLDWEKTWRNWMRKEQRERDRPGQRASGRAVPGRSTTDDRVAQAQALKAELGLTQDPQLNLIRGELA